jgi:hypothetical protein
MSRVSLVILLARRHRLVSILASATSLPCDGILRTYYEGKWCEGGNLTGKTTVSGQAAASGRSPDEVLKFAVRCRSGRVELDAVAEGFELAD